MIDENKTRLLSFCISQNRPRKLADMIESVYRNKSDDTELFIYLQEDDRKLDEYLQVVKGINYKVGRRLFLSEAANHITCELFPNIKYYQLLNDDHYVHTKWYDDLLISVIEDFGGGWGMSCGDDLMSKKLQAEHRHMSAEVISGNIPRTLGYYITPLLQHYCIDDYLRDLAYGIGRAFMIPDVVIEHRHVFQNVNNNITPETLPALLDSEKSDENYRWVYSDAQQEFGRNGYAQWCARYKSSDIAKIKQKMEEHHG